MGACFRDFLDEFTWPGCQPNGPHIWLKFFFKSRLSSESLESLIGFLAYLEPKLWLKKQKLVKVLPPQMFMHIVCIWMMSSTNRADFVSQSFLEI